MKYFAIGLLAAHAAAQTGPVCCNAVPPNCADPSVCPSPDPKDLFSVSASALEVTELIDGFLIGALEVEHVENLDTCIKDINPLVTDMTKAVEDFKDGSFSKIADGINQLGLFIQEVGIGMQDCSQVSSEDAQRLEKMGEAFLHPKQLIINAEKSVLHNGVEIYKDIKAAGQDMQNGEYEKAGKEYGTVAATVLWGTMNQEYLKYEQFTQ